MTRPMDNRSLGANWAADRLLAPLPDLLVDPVVRAALAEDLGRAGDVTAAACVPAGVRMTARFAARKPGRIAGLDCARLALAALDPAARFAVKIADGQDAPAGGVLAEVEADARALLSAERVALNLLGRLSGVATLTAAYAKAIEGTDARITCTRKTTPGLRALEKYAVRCGGGINHRYGLDDAILIKDNHIAACGGVGPALQRARAAAGHLVKIEIEVDTLAQLDEALPFEPDVVMLDNFSLGDLRLAVARAERKVTLEASGGVTLETVRAIAETGVDVISSGALTHSAPALDIGWTPDTTSGYRIPRYIQDMTSTRMPVLFVGHGSPMAAIEHNRHSDAWAELGRRLPRPKAILAISAHWESKGILVTRAERPRTIHDFYGFPPELYAQRYDAPGDPELARRVEAMLAPYARADLDCWGYDHGTWSVLMHMYPEADVPVIQLSMDLRLTPRGHYQVGKALAALRDEGVLILGSGNIVHNLRLFRRDLDTPPAPFAARFNETVKARILAGDDDALIDYASLDPEVRLCFPEPEHFHPLLYVLGAREPGEPVEFVNDEVYSTISMTSVLIGNPN